MDVINLIRPAQENLNRTSSSNTDYRNEESSFSRAFEEVDHSRKSRSEETPARDTEVEKHRSTEKVETREKDPVRQREKTDESVKTEQGQPVAEQKTKTDNGPDNAQNDPATRTDAETTSQQKMANEAETNPENTVSLMDVLIEVTQNAGTNLDSVIRLQAPVTSEIIQTAVQATPLVAETGNPGNIQITTAIPDLQRATLNMPQNVPGAGMAQATQAQELPRNLQNPAANATAETASAEDLKTLMAQPKANEKLLNQIREQMSSKDGISQIRLQPSELGDLQIQRLTKNGKSTIQISATESVVQNTLEKNTQMLKSIFNNSNVDVVGLDAAKTGSASTSGQEMGSEGFLSTGFGSESNKATQVTDAGRTETFTTRMETAISDRYGIRNLHEHILDQLRIRMDNVKNEARIQLNPPELGEIKIHMVMEERGLAVRIEANESLTRQLLERDLQQLKDTLAEAGIDVGRFDINAGRDPSLQSRSNASGSTFTDFQDEGIPDEEMGNRLDIPQGAVRMNPGSTDVDYLVY